MSETGTSGPDAPALPRWDVSDVHPSLTSRSFQAALEQFTAAADRIVARFDELGVRAIAPRAPTDADIANVESAILGWNEVASQQAELSGYVHAFAAVDSRDETAQSVGSQVERASAVLAPLLGRLAEHVAALGPEALASRSDLLHDHVGPLLHLAERVAHQMPERDEQLYAELRTTGSAAWANLHRTVTSQLSVEVELPSGRRQLPITAVRGLAADPDPSVRRAALAAELAAWPTVAPVAAAALNAIKGEAITVNRRRGWASPLDASCFANNVSTATYRSMNAAIDRALPDLHRWMRTKARLHGRDGGGHDGGGHAGGLPWADLFAPLPGPGTGVAWDDGIAAVRSAFAGYSPHLGGLVDRALAERWIDVEPRDAKRGGASCASFVDDRSLILLNWNGSADGVQTAAHELGHAYHNTQLAHRTMLQRRIPMALAETASIFCETLMVESGLDTSRSVDDRAAELRLLDVDLQGTLQVVVDIRSRVLFETEVFARRERRTLGVSELDELMLDCQSTAYGNGLAESIERGRGGHPHMWVVKTHYYSSLFYNWPYTFGLLFGLGLFARYREDPERFRAGYDDLLARAGTSTAEELGLLFDLDITGEAFWEASLDVVRSRISRYAELARSRT